MSAPSSGWHKINQTLVFIRISHILRVNNVHGATCGSLAGFMPCWGARGCSMPKRRAAAKRTAGGTLRSPRRLRRPSSASVRVSEAALAAFAHDIRTPLTGIIALSELLATSELGERERRWIATLKSTAEHLSALTTLVVDAVKAQTGGLVLRRELFDPRRLAEAIASSLAARAEPKGLTSRVTIADDLPDAV